MPIDWKEEEVVVGRSLKQIEKYGTTATGYIGKVVVSAGEEPVLGKKVLLDLARPHLMLICGKRGGGKCLTGDTLITLDDGREIPIKDLEKENNCVATLNNELKIDYTKKTKFFKRKVNEILKITLRSGKEITLTPEHPLFTINGWVPAETLSKGARIATPRTLNNFGNKNLPEHEIKILAYLLAEGHLSNNFILFSNIDPLIFSDFEKAINDFDTDLQIKMHSKPGCYRIVSSKNIKNNEKSTKGIKIDHKCSLRKYLENLNLYGNLSPQKYIPDIIFQTPKSKLSLFLNRLFSCDGSIYFDKNTSRWRIEYDSASKKLIYQVQSLLLKFGILSNIRQKNNSGFINFELEIQSQHIPNFIQEIGFFGKKEALQKKALLEMPTKRNPNIDTIPKELWKNYRPKNWVSVGNKLNYHLPKAARTSIKYCPSRDKLLNIANADNNKSLELLATSDIFWDEIKNMERINGSYEVYDILVPNHHNFVANNIFVHNSYTLSVIIEEFAKQPFEIKERLSLIIIDTVGIFWTMKFENKEQAKELNEWNLKPEGIEIRNLIPYGKQDFYKEKNIPFDAPFSIKTSQMGLEDWLTILKLTWKDPESALLSRTLEFIQEKVGTMYDIEDIISIAKKDTETNQDVINSLINRLKLAKSWGLFSKMGTSMKEFARPGTITNIDVSTYKQAAGMEAVQELVVAIIGKRLFEERMLYRKEEEMNLLAGKRKESEMPIVWMIIDEAHMFMPQDRQSLALDVLLQWVRVGRQPGLSLILATQRPNKLHSEAFSQCDLFISMRLTAQEDINAVSTLRPSYLNIPMDKYFAQLPTSQGYAILLDDNTEKTMIVKIRPRLTWDGGKTASVFQD